VLQQQQQQQQQGLVRLQLQGYLVLLHWGKWLHLLAGHPVNAAKEDNRARAKQHQQQQ
jgi:hypothetical protein